MAPWVCPSALPSQGSISNPPDFNLTSLKFPPILLLQTAHFSFHLSVCCSLLLLWQFYRPFFCSKFLRRTCPHFFAKFGCWHLLFPGAFCVCSLIMKNPCYLGSVPRPLLGQHLPFLHQCVAMSSHCSVPVVLIKILCTGWTLRFQCFLIFFCSGATLGGAHGSLWLFA